MPEGLWDHHEPGMKTPLQITFRDMDSSPAVEARLREKVETLEHVSTHITACRVVVGAPTVHHRKGAGSSYQVAIELSVPGGEIVVSHDKGDAADHDDVYVALRDAFAAAKRRLQHHDEKLRS